MARSAPGADLKPGAGPLLPCAATAGSAGRPSKESIMLRSRLLPLLLLPVLVLLMAFREAPLVDPQPIAVPSKVDARQVEKVIKQALIKREWMINSDEPGKLTATYARRGFSATIAIGYDRKQIQIKYVDSTDLKYEVKNGQRYIHKNYNSWIQNLMTDISGNLTLAGL
jgi:hypothetical protein